MVGLKKQEDPDSLEKGGPESETETEVLPPPKTRKTRSVVVTISDGEEDAAAEPKFRPRKPYVLTEARKMAFEKMKRVRAENLEKKRLLKEQAGEVKEAKKEIKKSQKRETVRETSESEPEEEVVVVRKKKSKPKPKRKIIIESDSESESETETVTVVRKSKPKQPREPKEPKEKLPEMHSSRSERAASLLPEMPSEPAHVDFSSYFC
jgi:hypothetical protein